MAKHYIAETGEVKTISPVGRKWTLKELQTAVDGWIEAVPGTGARAYCNEDGRRLGLTFNIAASSRFNQRLVGNVIELEPGDKQ